MTSDIGCRAKSVRVAFLPIIMACMYINNNRLIDDKQSYEIYAWPAIHKEKLIQDNVYIL